MLRLACIAGAVLLAALPVPVQSDGGPAPEDQFQMASLARWSGPGAWKVTETVAMDDLDCRDIYFSPEEPSGLAWVGLWKENDGAVKACFAQITGNPGLEPSYAPWYGSGRSPSDWTDFARRHQMRVGPLEEAHRTTRVECPTLITRDAGATWRSLGSDRRPQGPNLRVVQLPDGSYATRGVCLLRCRDGRLVSTGIFEGDNAHGENNPRLGDLITLSESLDNGKTWSPTQHLRPPDGTVIKPDQMYEENALAELADGRLLAVIRADPGSPCETYLTRLGPGRYSASSPVVLPVGHTGMPELVRGTDGVIWYWGLDGHWYTLDEGKTWQPAPARFTSYYGKLVEAAPGLILSVTQSQVQDCPYPWSHDSSVEAVRFRYRRTGIVEQTDGTAPARWMRPGQQALGDLHLRAQMRLDAATGLLFRASADGASGYAFAVIMPGTAAYKRWFPPELQAPVLSANYTADDTRTAATGYPMAVLARLDAGKLTVLRGTRVSGVKQGDWVQVQVKARGDLLQGAVNGELGPEPSPPLGSATNRDTGPTYAGAHDDAYRAGAIGLLTDGGTGAFADLCAWDAPQTMRELWRRAACAYPPGPRPAASLQADGFTWAFSYDCNVIPPAADPPWEDEYSGENIASADAGVLTLKSTVPQQEHYEIYAPRWWSATPGVGTTVECRVQVVSSAVPGIPAALLSFANGAGTATLYLYTDRVGMGREYATNTTDGFHTYRITLLGTETKLYVDGNPQPAITAPARPRQDSILFFGDSSPTGIGGETRWKHIRWTNAGAYPPAGKP